MPTCQMITEEAAARMSGALRRLIQSAQRSIDLGKEVMAYRDDMTEESAALYESHLADLDRIKRYAELAHTSFPNDVGEMGKVVDNITGLLEVTRKSRPIVELKEGEA